MNKSLLIGGTLALILTACATGPQTIYTRENPRLIRYTLFPFAPPNPTAPNVFIVAGEIVIDQEPIRPPGNQQGDPITIYFALQDPDPDYVFPQNGVEIKEHPNFCSPKSDYLFLCQYSRPTPGTIYRYTLRVKHPHGRPVQDLDPSIMN
jgi:hypothetical protein